MVREAEGSPDPLRYPKEMDISIFTLEHPMPCALESGYDFTPLNDIFNIVPMH